MATLEAIRYHAGQLEVLDQLLLPESCQYVSISNAEDAWKVIREMKVFLHCPVIKFNLHCLKFDVLIGSGSPCHCHCWLLELGS